MNTVTFVISMESYTYEIVKTLTTFLEPNALVKNFNVIETVQKDKWSNGTQEIHI